MNKLYVVIDRTGRLYTVQSLNGYKPSDRDDAFGDMDYGGDEIRDRFVHNAQTILFIDGRDSSVECLKGKFTMEAVN